MYQGYVETQSKIEDRLHRIMKGEYGRAEVLLKLNMELLLTQQIVAKSKAKRLAREASLEIKESVA